MKKRITRNFQTCALLLTSLIAVVLTCDRTHCCQRNHTSANPMSVWYKACKGTSFQFPTSPMHRKTPTQNSWVNNGYMHLYDTTQPTLKNDIHQSVICTLRKDHHDSMRCVVNKINVLNSQWIYLLYMHLPGLQ